MLALVDLPGFGQVQDYVFYLIIAIIILIVVFVLVFFKLKGLRTLSTKEEQELYEQLTAIAKRKAKVHAKLAVLDQAKKYGRILPAEYVDKAEKLSLAVERIDKEMDEVLNKLAEPFYRGQVASDTKLVAGKVDYLLQLQGRIKDLESRLAVTEQSSAQGVAVSGEKQKLEEEFETFESTQKDRILDLETRLDDMTKKFAQEQARLKALSEEYTDYKARTRQEGGKKPAPTGKDANVLGRIADLEQKVEDQKTKLSEYSGKMQLYSLLISKYREYIESNESKSIQDLKNSVNPSDQYASALADKIRSEFPEYSPDEHALKACEKAYKVVLDEIDSVPSIGITFWLNTKEMLENKVADFEDKAIFTCSVFRSLGADAKVLICEMEDGSNRPLVLITTPEKSVLCDPNWRHGFQDYSGTRDEAIVKYQHDDVPIKRVAYEFNDKDYKQY